MPSRPPSHRRGRPVAVAVPVVAAAVVLVACGRDPAPSAERFCGEIEVHLSELTDPTLAHVDDVEPVLDLYRDIAEVAPLAIEAEWRQLVTNYETASTVVPDDPESVQRAVTMAYRSEQAAASVDRWLQANCALSMGPVATIVDQGG